MIQEPMRWKMSKTIEFIEQATIANQRRLEQYKKDLEYYQKDVSLIDHGAKIFQLKHDIEHIEKIVLPNLKQIKAELEAWEIVKEKQVDIFYINVCKNAESYNKYKTSIRKLTNDELDKLKKALEIEE